jgi:hypothetical protein
LRNDAHATPLDDLDLDLDLDLDVADDTDEMLSERGLLRTPRPRCASWACIM